MTGHLSPRAGVLALLAIAVTFASNHVAARVAFDHGASVAAAVTVRSGITAIALYLWLRAIGATLTLPRATLARAAAIGALVALQSFCLYSAVARIPVALALLSFPPPAGRPATRTLVAMPVALVGLAFALDVFGQAAGLAGRWAEIGAGVTWALAAALSFAFVLLLTGRWLKEMDGRLRTLLTMGVTALIVGLAGASSDGFAWPREPAGWVGLTLLTAFYGSAITALFIVLPRLGAANFAVVLNIEPIAALLLAWLLLGQAVTPLQLLGALIVIGAITVPALKR